MEQRPRRLWADMTAAEIAVLDTSRLIAVLPVAAIEQHGPHLPLAVDAIIAQGILDHALTLVPDELPVTVLPLQAVGYSVEHRAFPGTLSLSADTLAASWRELGRSLADAGVRKLVIFNGHGGNPPVMDIVARDLRARHGMLVVGATWFALGLPDDLADGDATRHDIHGGIIETSIMLHLRPDLVHMDRAEAFTGLPHRMAEVYTTLTAAEETAFGWMAQDLHEQGVVGDATSADAETGRRLVRHAAERLVELLRETDRFEPDFLGR